MNSSPGSIKAFPRTSNISSAPSPPKITFDGETPEYDAIPFIKLSKFVSGY
jgi:hypothetical protein